jgi:adenosylcobinamide kinase/adenosylcobinamide-phosphate guanylyltransferase
MPPFILVTGGCRSGKSAYAQRLAEGFAPERLYIATAEPGDDEMRERIRLHQEARGPGWRLHELAPDRGDRLWQTLAAICRRGEPVLLDCLTLWAAGRMRNGAAPADFPQACDRLLDALRAHDGPVLLVHNEVGMGVVPETASGRAFRDMAGLLGAKAAQAASSVVFMVSGIPLVIKGVLPIEVRHGPTKTGRVHNSKMQTVRRYHRACGHARSGRPDCQN